MVGLVGGSVGSLVRLRFIGVKWDDITELLDNKMRYEVLWCPE